jgi:hypothetical protein
LIFKINETNTKGAAVFLLQCSARREWLKPTGPMTTIRTQVGKSPVALHNVFVKPQTNELLRLRLFFGLLV